MSAHQADHPVSLMCRVLGVSRSGYYAWRGRPPSARDLADADLADRVRAVHERSRGTYGAPRVHAELAEEGRHVGRKRVARLMRRERLRGVCRRGFRTTTRRDPASRAAPDLVRRDFTADGPDQLWVADITYVRTWVGFLYLAVVIDAWSRRVVGWSMLNSLHTRIVTEALEMAVRQRQPSGVVHHSDQGSQYTSVDFGRRCEAAGVRPSTGSVGDCYDNAMAESFFASLETELLLRESFPTRAAARLAIFEYIEGFYNPHRRHSGLGYRSPIDYERRAAVAPGVSSP